jgi:DNA-directed RNA polymerase subunit RPC12/RpoP
VPIDIQCEKCKKRFRVPDKFGGRRVKCPNCAEAILVQAGKPAEGDSGKEQPTDEAAADSDIGSTPAVEPERRPAAAKKPAQPDSSVEQRKEQEQEPEPEAPADEEDGGQWYLQTDDGEQYGPVDREELEAWVAEGRIDGTCQLLCDGWDQWKWADEVFPHLAEEASTEDAPLVAAGDSGKAIGPASSKRSEKKTPTEDEAPAGGVERILTETRPWVFLMAMVGFGAAGLGGLFWLVVFILSAISFTIPGILVAIVMLATCGLVGWAAFHLLVYAQRIGTYLAKSSSAQLEQALVAQRSFWRLAGILALATIAAWFVTLLLLLILALAGVALLGGA